MSLFRDFILGPIQEGQKNPDAGIPIPMPKLSKYTDYINKGNIIVISGRPESGKTSFMDHMYFMNVFKWWKEFDYEKDTKGRVKLDDENMPVLKENPGKRPPLKLFYFNMKSSARIKLQKWLCLYLKLQFNTTIDIATLNNGVGRLYNLDSVHKAQIATALEFFEYMEDEVLTLVSGEQSPSSIYNKVHNYMNEVGSVDETGQYILKPEHEGLITMVYIDTVENMLSESDGFHMMDSDGIKKKVGQNARELKVKYGVTTVIVSPSKLSNSRMVRDSEPSYKDLGVYAKIADIGLVTYNPFIEGHKNYQTYPTDELVINGKNRLRLVTLVRNYKGQENITVGSIFIGECGYFREAEHPSNEAWYASMIGKLMELP